MGQSINTGSVEANITSNVTVGQITFPLLDSTMTVKTDYGVVVGASSTNLYTIPNNKVFHCYSIVIKNEEITTSTYSISGGGTVVLHCSVSKDETFVYTPSTPIFIATEGTDVGCTHSGGGRITISGILVDA